MMTGGASKNQDGVQIIQKEWNLPPFIHDNPPLCGALFSKELPIE